MQRRAELPAGERDVVRRRASSLSAEMSSAPPSSDQLPTTSLALLRVTTPVPVPPPVAMTAIVAGVEPPRSSDRCRRCRWSASRRWRRRSCRAGRAELRSRPSTPPSPSRRQHPAIADELHVAIVADAGQFEECRRRSRTRRSRWFPAPVLDTQSARRDAPGKAELRARRVEDERAAPPSAGRCVTMVRGRRSSPFCPWRR